MVAFAGRETRQAHIYEWSPSFNVWTHFADEIFWFVVVATAAVSTLTNLLHNRTRYFKIFDNFYRIYLLFFFFFRHSFRFLGRLSVHNDDDVANGRIGIWTMCHNACVSLTKSLERWHAQTAESHTVPQKWRSNWWFSIGIFFYFVLLQIG